MLWEHGDKMGGTRLALLRSCLQANGVGSQLLAVPPKQKDLVYGHSVT